jgi:hypothetical protein
MDYSFIRFLSDFEQAKRNENSPVASLIYSGLIQQLPNETFTQITSIKGGVSLLGSLIAELVDNCGNVIKDLDGLFYYDSFTDQNGDDQIKFEFGMIGEDFYSLPLHLKLTDLGNGATLYSNPFLVTSMDANKTSRFDYTNNGSIYNIDYATAQIIQSIRLSFCYEHTPVNKMEFKQYTTSNGYQINYRNSTTFLRKNLIEYVDNFVNDRLNVLFAHEIIFFNGERVTVSEFQVDERKGDSNYFTGNFTTNKQGDIFIWSFQIFQPLQVVSYTIDNGGIYSNNNLPTPITEMVFNKNVSVEPNKKAYIYQNNTLIDTADIEQGLDNSVVMPFLSFNDPYAVGLYRLLIGSDAIHSGIIYFDGYKNNEFTFSISDAEFDSDDFNSDFLI